MSADLLLARGDGETARLALEQAEVLARDQTSPLLAAREEATRPALRCARTTRRREECDRLPFLGLEAIFDQVDDDAVGAGAAMFCERLNTPRDR